MAGKGVSGGKPFQKGPVSKTVFKANGNSAGLKPGDGNLTGGAPKGTIVPTKKVANPNGNTPMGKGGTNKHANIAKGPGKPGKTKR